MYADFEFILELMGPVVQGSLCDPLLGPGNNPRMGPHSSPGGPYGAPISTTRGINIHVPSGWCIFSKFAYGEVKDPLALHRGKDCVRKFSDHVIGEAHRLYGSFPEKPMEPLTPKQWKDYKHLSSCHIC